MQARLKQSFEYHVKDPNKLGGFRVESCRADEDEPHVYLEVVQINVPFVTQAPGSYPWELHRFGHLVRTPTGHTVLLDEIYLDLVGNTLHDLFMSC